MKLNLDIIESVKQNGGATLTADLQPASLDKGYMVSTPDDEHIISLDKVTAFSFDKLIKKAQQLNGFIGLWLNDNKLYIDISQNIEDKEQAIKTGLENKQLAIYDIKKGTAIEL